MNHKNIPPLAASITLLLILTGCGGTAEKQYTPAFSHITPEDERVIDSTAKAKTAAIMAENEREREQRPIYRDIEECDKQERDRAYQMHPLPDYNRDSKGVQKIKNDARDKAIEEGEKACREQIAKHYKITVDSLRAIERHGNAEKWYIRK